MNSRNVVVVLRSYWNGINIGDMGHAPGTLRVLQQHLPGVQVVLWLDRRYEPLRQMLWRHFPEVGVVEGQLDRQGKPDTPELREALEAADVVVQNSSMGEEAEMMQACREMGKPFGLFAQSYFPWIGEKQHLMDAVRDAAFVYCRDTPTVETLRHAGVRPPVLGFNPDGCFGFDLRDDDAAESYLTDAGLEPGKFITLQLRTNTQKISGTDDRLNPANPTPEQIADDERRATTFRTFITRWVEQTGRKVLIAPEAEKEIGHNRRLIVERLPEQIRRHVVLRDTFWPTAEAAAVFARAHTVVCHEPHSCIFALAGGTPILHAYSAFHGPKYHMFADIGLGQWLLPLDEWEASDIFERLMTIDRDYEAAREQVAQAMRFVHRRYANTCRTILDAAKA